MPLQKLNLKGYNEGLNWQLVMNLKFMPEVLVPFQNTEDLTSGLLVIADFGCSEGFNSIYFFKKIFASFRQSSSKEISITHTDLPENNWNKVKNLLDSSEESYLGLGHIFASTIGKTFYEQLFTNNTVHLAHSRFAFHYKLKKTNIENTLDKHTAIAEQAMIDITTFLSHRINELVPGGILCKITSGSNPDLPNIFDPPIIDLAFRKLIEKELLIEVAYFQ